MIVRCITFSHFRAHTASLFFNLKFLDIYKLNELYVLTFISDLYHDRTPHSIYDYFMPITHPYNTRLNTSVNFALPKPRINLGKYRISFVGAKLWNDLSPSVRNITCRKKNCCRA